MAFLYPVTEQIKTYFGLDGAPLHGGTIYFGIANQDPEVASIAMFWDAAGTKPAGSVFRTVGGKVVRNGIPANVFAVGDFSSTLKDSQGRIVYTSPNSTDIQLALSVTGTAAGIGIVDAGNFYTSTNVEGALQEVGVSLASLAAAVLAAMPVGTIVDTCAAVADPGFVLGSGLTIGGSNSGATSATHQRANADTQNLFTMLWTNEPTNAILHIQDNAGTPTIRGVSASADFIAGKRMPTPDCRGRTRASLDNMGGVAATRMTAGGSGIAGTTLYASGGVQTYVLVSPADLPSHTHPLASFVHTHDIAHGHPGSTADPHTHVQVLGSGGSVATAGAGAVGGNSTNTSVASVNTLTIAANVGSSGAANPVLPTVTNATGGGGAHQNTQPTIMFNSQIKL